jgi:hypothetical protein
VDANAQQAVDPVVSSPSFDFAAIFRREYKRIAAVIRGSWEIPPGPRNWL